MEDIVRYNVNCQSHSNTCVSTCMLWSYTWSYNSCICKYISYVSLSQRRRSFKSKSPEDHKHHWRTQDISSSSIKSPQEANNELQKQTQKENIGKWVFGCKLDHKWT